LPRLKLYAAYKVGKDIYHAPKFFSVSAPMILNGGAGRVIYAHPNYFLVCGTHNALALAKQTARMMDMSMVYEGARFP